jgi:hypothetical protein
MSALLLSLFIIAGYGSIIDHRYASLFLLHSQSNECTSFANLHVAEFYY